MPMHWSAPWTVAIPVFALLGACAAPNAPDRAATAPAPQVVAVPAPRVAEVAAASNALVNPGFESTRANRKQSAEGWDAQQHVGLTAYTFTVDRETKHTGEASLRIRNLRPEVYGSIIQKLAATPYRGRSLRFSVWLRTENVVPNDFGRGATPLLQAWGGGSPGVSASFEVAAIAGTTEWIRREVGIDVPATAEWIEVGVTLTGSGTVWLDDAVLETVSR